MEPKPRTAPVEIGLTDGAVAAGHVPMAPGHRSARDAMDHWLTYPDISLWGVRLITAEGEIKTYQSMSVDRALVAWVTASDDEITS